MKHEIIKVETFVTNKRIAHPHLLVRANIEWFLPARATFRVGLASNMQATPGGGGGSTRPQPA